MKKVLFVIILFIVFGCGAIKYIPLEGYVRLSQLDLTPMEKFILGWRTDYNSEFAIYNSRYQCFYYKVDYSYKDIVK